MVRGKYRRYSDEDLNTALRLIGEGKISQNKASKDFNIFRQTLNRLSNGKNNSKRGGGRPTILTHEQEKLVVSALVNMDSWGFAQSEMQTAKVIKLFIDSTGRKNTFKEGVPGKKFMRLFYAKWKNELSRRSPEHLTMSRATACSENVVNSWFRLLGTWLIKLDLKAKPAQMFNCDESGFNTDSSSEKFFTKRGRKNPVKVVGGNGKESYTVLECSNAMGDIIPSYVLFKGKHLYTEWCSGGPKDTAYNVTDSGWMAEHSFYAWVQHFINDTNHIPRPILLIYDGHSSHISYRILQLAKLNGISIIKLPPHTSHLLQPLDLGVFKPVKTIWRKILDEYFRQSRFFSVGKSQFPKLLKKLRENHDAFKKQHAASGFNKAGIFPFDKTAIDWEKLSPLRCLKLLPRLI